VKRLIHVSSGLDPDQGGVAKAGRLLVRIEQEYAREHSLDFRIFSLSGTLPRLGDTPIRHFEGRQVALMLAVWRYAMTMPQTAVIFDHLGPSRACGVLPLRIPYMIFLHGVEIWRPLQRSRVQALLRAKRLLINSQYSANRAHALHPWLPTPQVLHLPLEQEAEAGEVDSELLARVGLDYILIVGRLDPIQHHKGHDDLLAALPQVLQMQPSARLVIAGAGGDRARLEQVAAGYGVADHVIFTGFVNSATLSELFRRCRVFAMPSRDDGYGLVYLEAMQARKPCIGLASGSASEIIRDNETGLLIDSSNLASALLRLLGDADLAQRFGEAGYRRLEQEFAYSGFRSHMFEQLDNLMQPSNTSILGNSR
jgi:phosphatidyl-myo-inositol dimannoside synthase